MIERINKWDKNVILPFFFLFIRKHYFTFNIPKHLKKKKKTFHFQTLAPMMRPKSKKHISMGGGGGMTVEKGGNQSEKKWKNKKS